MYHISCNFSRGTSIVGLWMQYSSHFYDKLYGDWWSKIYCNIHYSIQNKRITQWMRNKPQRGINHAYLHHKRLDDTKMSIQALFQIIQRPLRGLAERLDIKASAVVTPLQFRSKTLTHPHMISWRQVWCNIIWRKRSKNTGVIMTVRYGYRNCL